jgi:hypothetical protein
MERITATYHLGGHTVEVIEMIDDDVSWFELVVDNTVLPVDAQITDHPTEAEARALLERWLGHPPG